MRFAGILAVAALSLAACDVSTMFGDGTSTESTDTVTVDEPAVEDPTPEEPAGTGLEVIEAALPLPDFVASLQGQTFEALGLATVTGCVGTFDGFSNEFAGDPAGVRGFGWAWNSESSSPYDKILVTDEAGLVVGGGEGSFSRPDVPQANPEDITTDLVGWDAFIEALQGTVTAYAYDEAGATVCALNARTIGAQ